MQSKWTIIIAVIFVLLGVGIWASQQAGSESAEVACQNAAPGDPSCMTPEVFAEWCLQQDNFEGTPRCELEIAHLKSEILLLVLSDQKVKTYSALQNNNIWPLHIPEAVLWGEQREAVKNTLAVRAQFVDETEVNGEAISIERLGLLKDGHFVVGFSIPAEGVQGEMKGQFLKGRYNVDSFEVVEH